VPRSRLCLALRSTGESSETGRALCPRGPSPGSQRQPGAPHSHHPPDSVCPARAMVAKGAGLLDFTSEVSEHHIGRVSMQTVANSNLLITDVSSLNRLAEPQLRHGHRALYQQVGALLVNQIQPRHFLTDFGDKLVMLAEHAYSHRQLPTVENISRALIALPLPPAYQTAGLYFRALELIRRGELDSAQAILEQVVAEPSHRYTARAIQSLGVTFHARGELESALKLYVEAAERATNKGRFDLLTAVYAQKNIVVLKSANGDHSGALSDLERMLPLARQAGTLHPQVYYDYLNSIAVERSSLGLLAEARCASGAAIASPFATAYPEWRETFIEIRHKQRQASRSVLAVPRRINEINSVRRSAGNTHNLMQFPIAECNNSAETTQHPAGKPGRVLNFQEWKTAPKAFGNAVLDEREPEQRERMTPGRKLIRLMDLISRDETDDETIDRILEAVEQIVLSRRK
jgi:tetratricopeptide (TPR) repeat protein